MLLRIVSCLVLVAATEGALTAEELAKFTNSGVCGGTVSVVESGENYVITSNGLPDHLWTCVNPNNPGIQSYSFTVPKDPVFASSPRCTNLGEIGFTIHGVPVFNLFTGENLNAIEGDSEEEMDDCGGHNAPGGEYHYHELPVTTTCSNPIYDTSNPNPQFLGLALDGFPIYSQGSGIDLAILDECHGTTLPDGSGRYAYIAADMHFPYIMGCFKGTPVDNGRTTYACPTAVSVGEVCQCNGGAAVWVSRCMITCGVADCDNESTPSRCNSMKRKKRSVKGARRKERSVFTSVKMNLLQSVSSLFSRNRRSIMSDACHDPNDAVWDEDDQRCNISPPDRLCPDGGGGGGMPGGPPPGGGGGGPPEGGGGRPPPGGGGGGPPEGGGGGPPPAPNCPNPNADDDDGGSSAVYVNVVVVTFSILAATILH